MLAKNDREGNVLPEVKQIVGYFHNQIEDDEGNSVCVYQISRMCTYMSFDTTHIEASTHRGR